jgi:hypothetical protein
MVGGVGNIYGGRVMKEAKYSEITRYGWECPDCQGWNEEDDDPSYSERIICETCGESFEPVEE